MLGQTRCERVYRKERRYQSLLYRIEYNGSQNREETQRYVLESDVYKKMPQPDFDQTVVHSVRHPNLRIVDVFLICFRKKSLRVLYSLDFVRSFVSKYYHEKLFEKFMILKGKWYYSLMRCIQQNY